MPEVRKVPVTLARHKTPSFWFIIALVLAVPIGMLAQGGQGGGRGGGRGGAAGAPAVPGAPPVPGGPAAAAPAPQGRGGPAGGAPAAGGARGAAPVDLTGYWVSLVTEDWIERMSPDSPKSGTPQAGRGGGGGGGGRGGAGAAPAGAPPVVAASPDPCRAYGAAGSMRLPGRLNITWADENTLKVDMDSGTQTRLFHFGVAQAPAGEKTLQGYSIATWETGGGGGRGGGGRGGAGAAPAVRWGTLNVVTTNMKGGFLLTSRTSYTDNAVLNEQFIKSTDFGVDHLTVVAIITDPGGNHTTSSTFKKEPDGSKFSPTGCDIVR